MNRLIIIMLLVCFCATFFAQSIFAKNYQNPLEKYTINMPKGWVIKKKFSKKGEVYYYEKKSGANIKIEVVSLNKSFDDLVARSLKNLSERSKFQSVESYDFPVPGAKGYFFDYKYSEPDGDVIHSKGILVGGKKKIYSVMMSATDKSWNQYDKLFTETLKSFRP